MDINDDFIPCSVYEIITKSQSEHKLLFSVKDFVRSGDVIGIPLLLHEEKKDGLEHMIIPGYEYNLEQYITTFPYDKIPLIFSIFSVISSLPATNTDAHSRNVCVYMPQIPFCYKWTLQTPTFTVEIAWKNYGMITIIDWEHYVDAGKKSSSSSSTWSYKRDIWGFNFECNE